MVAQMQVLHPDFNFVPHSNMSAARPSKKSTARAADDTVSRRCAQLSLPYERNSLSNSELYHRAIFDAAQLQAKVGHAPTVIPFKMALIISWDSTTLCTNPVNHVVVSAALTKLQYGGATITTTSESDSREPFFLRWIIS
jgi:hypothetical protein